MCYYFIYFTCTFIQTLLKKSQSWPISYAKHERLEQPDQTF